MKNKLLLALFCAITGTPLYAQSITTFAGNGSTSDSPDGTVVSAAAIGKPQNITWDRFSNCYFYTNGKIRKINASGVIATITNSSASGTAYSGDGGSSTAAGIDPSGLTCDADGNIYICDYSNNRVRKVNAATGVITTVVGNGSPRSASGPSGDGGPATAASLLRPNAVAFDHAGTMYISDQFSIRRIDASGTITTIAGQFNVQGYTGDGGPATAATIGLIYCIASDSHNNIYIYSHHNATENEIRKIDAATGVITTVAGGGTDAIADGASATGIKLGTGSGMFTITPADEILFAVAADARVMKINASGTITTVSGNGTASYCGDGGPASAACLGTIFGLAFDNCYDLYIADFSNSRIRKIDFDTPCPPAAVSPVVTKQAGLLLTPNPATGTVAVIFEHITTLTITDMIGKTHYAATLPGINSTQVDVSMLPPGVYSLMVNGTATARLLKQ